MRTTEHWTDRWTDARRAHEQPIAVDAAFVEVTAPEGTRNPRVTRLSIADAFRRPERLGIHDTAVQLAVTEALATRLTPDDLQPGPDRDRLAFFRAWDPTRLVPDAWEYRWSPYPQELERSWALRLDASGCHGPATSTGVVAFETPDLTFVYGPPSPAMPDAMRTALRARLLGSLRPEPGLTGFPDLDHSRMAPETWSWGSPDGSFVELGPGYVRAGYDRGHDAGHTTWAPERVLSGDPRVQLGAPGEIVELLMSRLRAAKAS